MNPETSLARARSESYGFGLLPSAPCSLLPDDGGGEVPRPTARPVRGCPRNPSAPSRCLGHSLGSREVLPVSRRSSRVLRHRVPQSSQDTSRRTKRRRSVEKRSTDDGSWNRGAFVARVAAPRGLTLRSSCSTRPAHVGFSLKTTLTSTTVTNASTRRLGAAIPRPWGLCPENERSGFLPFWPQGSRADPRRNPRRSFGGSGGVGPVAVSAPACPPGPSPPGGRAPNFAASA
jgi:hypothetical protein